jgi:lipopolysaccharide transport system ATP-binding protein
MASVISVENLSKKYIIGHQKQERYTTLRDAIANEAKRFADKLSHPFAAKQNDSTHEEFWALKDVSFDIQQGDRVGIIGRNGAGKSTLLKILSRITEPTSGKISIKGRVASLLEVGTGFHPELSGRENIFLNGAILGMSKADIKSKFDEIVAFAEVERFLDTPVKRYSSGMYVRLAFAVAAHLEPEILIVDEVLAVGDAQFQKKCISKMEQVGKEGRTVLFVSHNMTVIQNLCTKAIWLDKGLLHSKGEVTDQITSYLKVGLINSKITRDWAVKCGSDLQLTHLEFSPNLVVSRSNADFVVELRASRALKISALAILVYSALGERVAILDLRQANGVYALDDATPLLIEGTVKSLPLVEGVYRVGLYIDYGEFRGNLLELLDLTVTNKPIKFDYAPYPQNSRGVVELDYQLL